MTFGSLFAGIGGMDLGLERAGMKCVWQVEIDPYATKVLKKHWPSVRRWDDVRTFPPEPAIDWACDVIAGGFPCQDISNAGKREGIDGARSGLWSEFARIIRVVRPSFVIVENVAALLGSGMGRVLGDLSSSGFDAEWGVLSACTMGAPFTRERVFIVAFPNGSNGNSRLWFHGEHGRSLQCDGFEQARADWLDATSRIARGTNGVASRMDRDRIRGLGNAVVPQVAQWIGKRLMSIADVAGGA